MQKTAPEKQLKTPEIRLLLGIHREFLRLFDHENVKTSRASVENLRLQDQIDAAREFGMLDIDFRRWIAPNLTPTEHRYWQRVLDKLDERGLVRKLNYGPLAGKCTNVQLCQSGEIAAHELLGER